MFTSINDTCDVWNSDTRLCDVGRCRQLRHFKLDSQITIFLTPRGGMSNTCP
jgi:hypothetical protein